jgi:hypothetical protein
MALDNIERRRFGDELQESFATSIHGHLVMMSRVDQDRILCTGRRMVKELRGPVDSRRTAGVFV